MVKRYKKYQKLYQKLVTDVKFTKNVMTKMAFHTFKMLSKYKFTLEDNLSVKRHKIYFI